MKILLPLILIFALGAPLGPSTQLTPPDTPEMAGFRGYTWSPDGTQIAFISSWGLLYIMNSDGTNLHILSAAETLIRYDPTDPVWSPDGSRIAFVAGGGPNYSIYVINADGTELTDISGSPHSEVGYPDYVHDVDPEWSKDSSKIFFIAGNPQGGMSINVIDADGENRTRLTTDLDYKYQLTLSPDKSKIAFLRTTAGYDDIYVMNTDGSSEKRLTNHPNIHNFGLVWSPDGSQIAFVATPFFSGTYIYLMNADGSNERSLVPFTTNAEETNPAWSPDGSMIAYISNSHSFGIDLPKLYIININGSNQTRLTGDSVYLPPLWSPDGTKLLFEHTGMGLNVFTFRSPNLSEEE